MDHAWYTRDVAEMQAWRRVGAHVWSSAVSALLALAYLAVARVRGVSSLMAAIFSPSEWATRGSLALAFAAMQLPVSLASTALLRPSRAAARRRGRRGPLGDLRVSREPGALGGRARAPSPLPPGLHPLALGLPRVPGPPPPRYRATLSSASPSSPRTPPPAPRRARSSRTPPDP